MLQKEIILPTKIKALEEKGNKGTYEIDKLHPGYGHTLGNSLRRIILSSIPGVAITRVFIDGVSHEFSTVEGVKEDAINIILNLKKVVFKLNAEEPMTLSLSVKGKGGAITAKDITAPSQVEVVNKDAYLFTLEKGKEVKIDFEIANGLGYVPKESIKDGKLAVGEIIMDTAFTPVRRASYEVSSTRVGDRTDFNKISFFVETDGSVSPGEVIVSSIEIMINQLKALLGDEVYAQEEKQESIAKLKLPEGLIEKIATAGIVKISDLESKTDEELLELEEIDEEDLEKIKKVLEK